MKQVLDNLTRYARGKTIAVAVSGGKDSMTLLHLVLHSGLFAPEKIWVVNVDHRIRGKRSASDSDFVRAFAIKNGLPFRGYSVDIPQLSAVSGRSIESEARAQRYAIFAELVRSTPIQMILTAHHASDNAETVLLHLFRGADLGGLRGMRVYDAHDINFEKTDRACFLDGFEKTDTVQEKNQANITQKLCLLRPMLGIMREQIDAYAQENGVPFVTDETNADSRYDRNFLRNEVLPLIRTRWPGADQSLLRLADCAQAAYDDPENRPQTHHVDVSRRASGEVRVRTESLLGRSGGRTVLYALQQLGVRENVYRKHILAVQGLAQGENGSRLSLGQNVIAHKEYDWVAFVRKSQDTCLEHRQAETVPFKLGQTYLGGVRISADKTDEKEAFAWIERLKEDRGCSSHTFEPRVLVLDANKIPNGAVLRFRKDGDRFKGMGGKTKKLKELLIDCKIPLRLRDFLPLLCYNDCVLAVFGLQISSAVSFSGSGTPICVRIKSDSIE